MAQVGLQVKIDVKEIYRLMCPECKKKMKELIQRRMAEQLAKRVLGEEEG